MTLGFERINSRETNGLCKFLGGFTKLVSLVWLSENIAVVLFRSQSISSSRHDNGRTDAGAVVEGNERHGQVVALSVVDIYDVTVAIAVTDDDC